MATRKYHAECYSCGNVFTTTGKRINVNALLLDLYEDVEYYGVFIAYCPRCAKQRIVGVTPAND